MPTMTEALEDLKIEHGMRSFEETAPPETRTHIINPPGNTHIWKPGMSAQQVVDIARAEQLEVVALCGYRWVPKYNPDSYDACENCIRIAGEIMREEGE